MNLSQRSCRVLLPGCLVQSSARSLSALVVCIDPGIANKHTLWQRQVIVAAKLAVRHGWRFAQYSTVLQAARGPGCARTFMYTKKRAGCMAGTIVVPAPPATPISSNQPCMSMPDVVCNTNGRVHRTLVLGIYKNKSMELHNMILCAPVCMTGFFCLCACTKHPAVWI